jgi:hypothetical protein
MQTFHFVHDYQAPAIDSIFEAYFDPEFALAQDREVDIIERTVLELTDGANELVRVCRVVPKRQLPALFRPLVAGELHYTESLRWFKDQHRMTIEIRPSLLKGRALISVDYQLADQGPVPGANVRTLEAGVTTGNWRLIQRVYRGTVTIEVPLLGGRIEKSIVADMESSLRTTAASTQAWIDHHRRPAATR